MEEQYGSDPKDILVAVGPSICKDCYEVSEDVIFRIPEKNFKEKDIGKICFIAKRMENISWIYGKQMKSYLKNRNIAKNILL